MQSVFLETKGKEGVLTVGDGQIGQTMNMGPFPQGVYLGASLGAWTQSAGAKPALSALLILGAPSHSSKTAVLDLETQQVPGSCSGYGDR